VTPDPAYATRRDVERAVRIRLLALRAGQDPVDAVMGIVGPVIEAKDRRYARLTLHGMSTARNTDVEGSRNG
jgi:hypothetical protein